MPSQALQKWSTERIPILDEIERAHRQLRGIGLGTRVAVLHIIQGYVVLLAAQFQAFCRELHEECVDLFVAPIRNPDHQSAFRVSLLLNRKLDRGNPNPGNIGSDFGRFNLTFWPRVDAHRPRNPAHRAALEELNTWRNAAAHADYSGIMLAGGRPSLPLAVIRKWRRACRQLALSFDDVMRLHLTALLVTAPW